MNATTLVTTDGEATFTAARIEDGDEFATVWFDRATAEKIAEWCATVDTDLDDSERALLHFDGDTLVIRDHGLASTVHPDSGGLYKVGDGWAWEIA